MFLFTEMKKLKEFLWNILILLWCKDVCLMRYWLKHLNFKLLFDWIFIWNYMFFPKHFLEFSKEFAKKFEWYLGKEIYKKKLINQFQLDMIQEMQKHGKKEHIQEFTETLILLMLWGNG